MFFSATCRAISTLLLHYLWSAIVNFYFSFIVWILFFIDFSIIQSLPCNFNNVRGEICNLTSWMSYEPLHCDLSSLLSDSLQVKIRTKVQTGVHTEWKQEIIWPVTSKQTDLMWFRLYLQFWYQNSRICSCDTQHVTIIMCFHLLDDSGNSSIVNTGHTVYFSSLHKPFDWQNKLNGHKSR